MEQTKTYTSQLQQYLPAIFRDEEFLVIFLSAFEKILLTSSSHDRREIESEEGLEDTIENLHRFFDPEMTPERFLPWLASWAALSVREDLSQKQKRDFIANMVQLYRRRGTKENLQKLLNIFTVVAPTITEASSSPEFQLGVHSTLGLDAYVSGGRPYFFDVSISFRTLVCPGEKLPLAFQLQDQFEKPVCAMEDISIQIVLTPDHGTILAADSTALTKKAGMYILEIPKGFSSAVVLYEADEKAENIVLTGETKKGLKLQQSFDVRGPSSRKASQLAIISSTTVCRGELLPLLFQLRDDKGYPAYLSSDTEFRLTLEKQKGILSGTGFNGNSLPDGIVIPKAVTSAVAFFEAESVGETILTADALDKPIASATQAITIAPKPDESSPSSIVIKNMLAFGRGQSSLASRQYAVTRALIEQEKPAHTDFNLKLVYPTMQLAVHSTIGVDTVLGSAFGT